MSVDTRGKIKGYVSHLDILNFIRQKWDPDAKSFVKKKEYGSISICTWNHRINEHSDTQDTWYILTGFITFVYKGEHRSLVYTYDNVNHFDCLDYYKELGLENMVFTETTTISLGRDKDSVDIIKTLVAQFGGGWIDENDYDDNDFYPVELNADGNIKPVIYVTMEEIYEKFGGIVIIKEN